jgi:hypothetical protein
MHSFSAMADIDIACKPVRKNSPAMIAFVLAIAGMMFFTTP